MRPFTDDERTVRPAHIDWDRVRRSYRPNDNGDESMKRPCNVLVIIRASDGQQMWYAGVLPAANTVADATRSQVHVEQQEGAFRPILTDDYRTQLAAAPPPVLDIKVKLAHQRTQSVGPVPHKILDAFAQGDTPIPVPPSVVKNAEGDAFTIDDWPTETELELVVRRQTAKIVGDRSERFRGKKTTTRSRKR